jgi:hypothetical protein
VLTDVLLEVADAGMDGVDLWRSTDLVLRCSLSAEDVLTVWLRCDLLGATLILVLDWDATKIVIHKTIRAFSPLKISVWRNIIQGLQWTQRWKNRPSVLWEEFGVNRRNHDAFQKRKIPEFYPHLINYIVHFEAPPSCLCCFVICCSMRQFQIKNYWTLTGYIWQHK